MVEKSHWTVLGSEEILHAPPYVTVTRERIRTDSGAEISDFYRVDLAPFVVCVPQLESGEIITLWQYKHGPRKWGLTFPAGYVDPGESPEDACSRELLEETGYVAGTMRWLGEFVDNGNQRGSVGNFYVARDCIRRANPFSGDLERMELRLMSITDVRTAIADGAINVVHHIAAWGLARDYLAKGREST